MKLGKAEREALMGLVWIVFIVTVVIGWFMGAFE